MASGVYDYERAYRGAGPLWHPRSMVGQTALGAYTSDGAKLTDPLANITAGLANNPVAAQRFFDVGNPSAKLATITVRGKPMTVNDRMKYLLVDRTWKPELGSDDSAGVLTALLATKHVERDGVTETPLSMKIGAQSLALTLYGHPTG